LIDHTGDFLFRIRARTADFYNDKLKPPPIADGDAMISALQTIGTRRRRSGWMQNLKGIKNNAGRGARLMGRRCLPAIPTLDIGLCPYSDIRHLLSRRQWIGNKA